MNEIYRTAVLGKLDPLPEGVAASRLRHYGALPAALPAGQINTNPIKDSKGWSGGKCIAAPGPCGG
jgi:hypothetical protein